jgi:AhpD family alkylhydroperoxidase
MFTVYRSTRARTSLYRRGVVGCRRRDFARRRQRRRRGAMDKLDEITRKRKEAHAKMLSLKSRVYEAFLRVEEAAFSDGALPKKTKELIAVGISVKCDCESCMQWHIEQAAGAGATMREVLEAIEVGIEMGGGPATVSARFALEVIERVFPNEVG